jgi:hypothetical protein
VIVAAPWRVAVCAGAFAVAVAVATVDVALAFVVALAACLGIAIAFADRRVVTAAVAVGACAIGAWRGVSAATPDRGSGSVTGHLGAGAIVLRGSVGDAGVPGRTDTIVVDVDDLATAAGTWHVSGAVVVEPRTPVTVLPGDTVDVQTSSLRAPPQRPGSLSVVALERVGVTAIASAAQVTVLAQGGPSPARLAQQTRAALTATVARTLPEPEATLVLGVAFGIHARITGAIRTPLQDAGLIHVVAVSGLMTYYYVYGYERRHLRPDLTGR